MKTRRDNVAWCYEHLGWSFVPLKGKKPVHEDAHASLSVSRGEDGRVLLHCHAGCSTTAVCQALGVRLGELFPPKEGRRGRIVATYDYRAAGGELLFQVVRFEPKDFKQRRPDGSGGWIWKLDDTSRVLYRLPELMTADPDEPIFVVEGERDVESLMELGFVCRGPKRTVGGGPECRASPNYIQNLAASQQ